MADEKTGSPDTSNPNASRIPVYRKMTDEEQALFNEGKAIGQTVLEYIEKVRALPDNDGRWCSIGQTQIQIGFMSLLRAVARPNGI